jgi:hypothetical protein
MHAFLLPANRDLVEVAHEVVDAFLDALPLGRGDVFDAQCKAVVDAENELPSGRIPCRRMVLERAKSIY